MSTEFNIKVCSSHAIYPQPGKKMGKAVLEVHDLIKIIYAVGTDLVDVEIQAKNIATNPLKFQAVHNTEFQVEGTATDGALAYTFSACPVDKEGYAIDDLTKVVNWVGIMTMKRGSEDSGGTWTGK
ncbi:hypothetical protein C7S18_21585 [Ahniella affigens]|uniref:Uncharacterized protein n=1 Tax=Ahniella affigens TaxID=2021234 RepID=A0A2P1PXN8_9GAMM|nr:hypothetical protein [Ahniella affigens]AVP99607.1 hypothetical protein C7S18_21585 [Ahniella affigens]